MLGIEAARTEARRLAVVVRSDRDDPRELERQQEAAKALQDAQDAARRRRLEITGLDAWALYLVEGEAHGMTERGAWGARHLQDHRDMASAGGQPFKRGMGTAQAGALWGLLSMPLA